MTFWYHAVADFGARTRYFWNRDRDELISEILIPLLSKQVVAAKRRGKKSLFNFGAISYLTVVKTKNKLERSKEGKPPQRLQDRAFVARNNVTEEFLRDIRLIQSTHLSRSLLQQTLSKPLKRIFVIMKFGDRHLDSAYKGVIKPVGELFGFEVIRIDEIEDSGNISTQVLENIARSQIIIAELTGERPNCYYECGYAHALGREIIFVIRKGEKIHFDLSNYRFIQWETEHELRRKLRRRLDSLESREEE
jgi:hypothetical protein